MPEVGGRSVADALRKVTSSQAAVTDAARHVAQELAAQREQERQALLRQLSQQPPPNVPEDGGTNEGAEG